MAVYKKESGLRSVTSQGLSRSPRHSCSVFTHQVDEICNSLSSHHHRPRIHTLPLHISDFQPFRLRDEASTLNWMLVLGQGMPGHFPLSYSHIFPPLNSIKPCLLSPSAHESPLRKEDDVTFNRFSVMTFSKDRDLSHRFH